MNVNIFKVFDILYPNVIKLDIYYIILVEIKDNFKSKLREEYRKDEN